jgi:hypothetical protein
LKQIDLLLPAPRPSKIVETDLMREVAEATKRCVAQGGHLVWTGPSRVGKTTTADRYLTRAINRQHEQTGEGFRALHFHVGGTGKGDQWKQSLAILYAQAHGVPLTPHQYRRLQPTGLAEQVVMGLQRSNTRLVFIDEAGVLTTDAIKAMTLVGDTAGDMDWPVSLVFIGMDDLPKKIESSPQVSGRISRYFYFHEYDFTQTKAFLAALHPHFAGARWDAEKVVEAEFIQKFCHGLPGKIVSFLGHVDGHLMDIGRELNIQILRGVSQLLLQQKADAHEAVKRRFAVGGDVIGAQNKGAPPGGANSRRRKGVA